MKRVCIIGLNLGDELNCQRLLRWILHRSYAVAVAVAYIAPVATDCDTIPGPRRRFLGAVSDAADGRAAVGRRGRRGASDASAGAALIAPSADDRAHRAGRHT